VLELALAEPLEALLPEQALSASAAHSAK
jgi:hypothetical protein